MTLGARAKSSRRQSVRRFTSLIGLLLFPVVLNYLSPYLIVHAAAGGIVNGSLLVFTGLLVLSLVLGRSWCAWACPGAALQEFCARIVGKPANRGRDFIKWIIWVPWLAAIVLLAIRAGGYSSVQPTYMTEGGISVVAPYNYAIYFSVVGLILVLCLAGGRRGFCHYACWMAPFMISGRAIRNFFGWRAVRLEARADKCTECGLCTRSCTMSLPVQEMVLSERIENAECILCAVCADTCPRGAISLVCRPGR
jgi:ferredoxin-type protein NapH